MQTTTDSHGLHWEFEPSDGCLRHPCGYLTSWLRDNLPESKWAMLEAAGHVPPEVIEALNQ